jgi:hypothetical protein
MHRLLCIVLLILLIVVSLYVTVAGKYCYNPAAVTGGSDGIITWPLEPKKYTKCLVNASVKYVKNDIREVKNYGPPSPVELENMEREAKRISARYGSKISTAQLINIRDMEIHYKARTSGIRAMQHGPEILAEHEGGDSVIDIAKKYSLPPMAVLRQILLRGGSNVTAVRKMIANPSLMPKKLAAEYPAIAEVDYSSRDFTTDTLARSQQYEADLGIYLKKLGIEFRTEDELRQAYTGIGPLLTPDYLLSTPITIDGHNIYWIDAKNYTHYGGKLVARKNAKQAEKYTAAFGTGAMVFSGGVILDKLPGTTVKTLLLDGSDAVRHFK